MSNRSFMLITVNCSASASTVLYLNLLRFTARYVRSVRQDVSPGKCVLLSTSRAVRRRL